MSEANVEIVRRGIEALNRGDLDAFCEGLGPEIEWEEMPSLGPDAAAYRGVTSVRGALESWLGMWTDYEAEAVRCADAGDDVVILFTERGRGRDSGVAVNREMGIVHTFRSGKVIHSRLFGNWSEALEAVGLSE